MSIQISDINSGLSRIIERFANQVDQFNLEHARLNDWLNTNDREIQKNLELSTLAADNEKFKSILHAAIQRQADFQALQDHLQQINITIEDFEQATGNTDGGKSAKIYDELQQRLDALLNHYADFLKRSKHISDQCERYLMNHNEVKQLSDDLEKSMHEFDQNLAANSDQSQNEEKLQMLLLNIQQHLDKLSLLATHEPASASPVMSTSTHIQNEIKEHVSLLDLFVTPLIVSRRSSCVICSMIKQNDIKMLSRDF